MTQGRAKPLLLLHRNGLVVSVILSAGTLIGSLLLHCGPAAVVRAVALAVVNTVNRQIVLVAVRHGPIPKGGKVVEPFGANRYAASPVIFIILRIGVVATGFHCAPYPIKTCFFAAVAGSTVSSTSLSPYGQLMPIASTALGIPCAQISPSHNGYISAVASASPHGLSNTVIASSLYNGQTPKSLTRQVNQLAHVSLPPSLSPSSRPWA